MRTAKCMFARNGNMASTVDLTKCFDDEAGFHEMQAMQQLQGLQAGINSLYGGLFDDTNPDYVDYLSTHRTHLSYFEQTALPSPSLSYQRNYSGRMHAGCTSDSQHEHLHPGFSAIGTEGEMQHMTDLMLSERSHPQAASCNIDVNCDDHALQYSLGTSAVEDELTGSAVDGVCSKRCSGDSPGAPTPASAESDKKRVKRENLGSQTPVPQPCKSTVPTSTDKKGLRSFSGQVCQKVRDKKTTTYNEVADELVQDFAVSELNEELKYDEKNIRRRVYDALNVLMALDIIAKDKKSISWRGFPSSSGSDEQDALQDALAKVEDQRKEQESQLEALILQYISTANLLKRNKADGARLDEAAGQPGYQRNYMPFVLVSTSSNAQIDVKLRDTQDKLHVKLTCPFQLHNDNSIMHCMNLYPLKEDLLPILGSRALVNFIISRRSSLFSADSLPEASDSADSSAMVSLAPTATLPAWSTASVEAPVTPKPASFDRKPLCESGTSSVKNNRDEAARR